MRKLMILMVLVSTMAYTAFGQKSNVPAKVKSVFTQKFPSATKVKWGMEDAKEWEAEFNMDGTEYSANFDMNGTWKETEYEIEISQIPEAVKAALDNEFSAFKIRKAEVSETSKITLYEVLLKNREEVHVVALDASGKVITDNIIGEDDED